MPLKKGSSRATVSENISELHHGDTYAHTAGKFGKARANAQAVAIALSEARKHRAHGGRAAAEAALPPDHQLGMRVPEGGSMCANCRFLVGKRECGNDGFVKWNGSARLPDPADEYCCDLWSRRERASGGRVHVGPIKGDEGGRSDVHEMAVPDGAYVLSADTVSHLGDSNTQAGLKKGQQIFGPNGPFGQLAKEYKKSEHGKNAKPVDCITAGGELVIDPSIVWAIGRRDLDHGHKTLDRWSMNVRKEHVKTLLELPPPAQD